MFSRLTVRLDIAVDAGYEMKTRVYTPRIPEPVGNNTKLSRLVFRKRLRLRIRVDFGDNAKSPKLVRNISVLR